MHIAFFFFFFFFFFEKHIRIASVTHVCAILGSGITFLFEKNDATGVSFDVYIHKITGVYSALYLPITALLVD